MGALSDIFIMFLASCYSRNRNTSSAKQLNYLTITVHEIQFGYRRSEGPGPLLPFGYGTLKNTLELVWLCC